MTTTTKFIALLSAVAFSSLSQAALLVTPIANSDFETGGAVGTFDAGVIDWAEGDASGYGVAFTQDEDSSSAVPLDGTNLDGDDNWGGFAFREDTNLGGDASALTLDGYGELFQQVGTFTSGESYDLTLNVGYRSDRGWGDLRVELFTSNSGTGVADADTLDGTRSSALAGYSVLDTFTYTTTPDTVDGDAIAFSLNSGTSGTAGNPIWLAFSIVNGSENSAANQTLVDDIAISVIPEPSTFALFGLAGLAALMVARRRR